MENCQKYPYLSCVHTTQGTASSPRFSNGSTKPLTQMPWGMNAYTLQTNSENNWFYSPYERSLEGIRLTHMPSPWVGDFGSLLLLPQRELASSQTWSGFRPEDTIIDPHYLRVKLLRHDLDFELTPTERGASLRLTCANSQSWYLSLLATNHNITAHYDTNSKMVLGWTNSFSGIGQPKAGFKLYFVLQFSKNIDVEHSQFNSEKSIHIALLDESITVNIATSFISEEQATINLMWELDGHSFDVLKENAANKWESLLSRIKIDTQNKKLAHTFYSCLYRVCLFPNKMYEINSSGKIVHYDSHNDCVRAGIMYTNNGFWDTFRTVYPLYSLFAPEELHEMLQGFLQFYQDTGWLPKWPSLHETGIMPGTLIDGVLADAAVKGILTPHEQALALEAMLKHASTVAPHPHGRTNLDLYLKYGYLPRDLVEESVNNTLDYAYGDSCIARIAEVLGKTDIASEYDCRSKNYRKLFDSKTGFMRGLDSHGNRSEAFDPFAWGGDYTEGSAWQNSFSACFDLGGLVELFGSKECLLEKIESIFSQPPKYHVGAYGFEIHEMTEMAAVNFGQFAISNQPSFHFPWLFAALGKPKLSECWRDRTVNELFSWEVDGFPGDEDNGSMAAWYIFSILGIYPLCPGQPTYVQIRPLADNISVYGRKLSPVTDSVWLEHEKCFINNTSKNP